MKIIVIIALLFIGSLSGSEYRKGLYAGIGAGYRNDGPIIPLEIVYGVNNNVLINLSHSSSIGIVTERLSGLGISYYMNDRIYAKAIVGKSYSGLTEYTYSSGLGFSLGVGLAVSKRTSLEVSYMRLEFDTTKEDGKTIDDTDDTLDMFSVAFKYRLF